MITLDNLLQIWVFKIAVVSLTLRLLVTSVTINIINYNIVPILCVRSVLCSYKLQYNVHNTFADVTN